MYELHIHRDAQKALKKAPKMIRAKALHCIDHLSQKGLNQLPFKIKKLKGKFEKFQYLEIKIHKDYRIVFRSEINSFYIRDAGTHNYLRTG